MYIGCKDLAQKIKNDIKEKLGDMPHDSLKPKLVIIRSGNDSASDVYVKGKIKDCDEVGILHEEIIIPDDYTVDVFHDIIYDCNSDTSVHGILVQLPLSDKFKPFEKEILNMINPFKDVDGFTVRNQGKLFSGDTRHTLLPCTAIGCIDILKHIEDIDTGFKIKGSKAVVVGRSNIVGKPVAHLLLAEGATVAVCHSQTKDLKAELLSADIVISAVGKAGLITAEMIKPGAVVVDVGINRNADNKLCGDVDAEVADKASYLTKVPGGVGLMTRAELLSNILTAYNLQG